MNLLLRKFAGYGLNRKRFTREDFFALCKEEGIEVVWNDGDASWYMEVKSKPFIVLSRELDGYEELFAMFHELAHHFCHGGTGSEQALFNCVLSSKDEFEANTVAVLALFPLKDFLAGKFAEDAADDAYLAVILKMREKIYLEYGI